MPKTSRFGRLFLFSLMLLMLAYQRPNKAGAVPAGVEHKLWSVYWTVEPGFTSTLEMKNNRVQESLTAHVSLYFERGEEYELTPIVLGPRQTFVLNLNDVMDSLPLLVAARGSKEGTAEVRFDASNGAALMGSISVVNPERGIGWNFPFYPVNTLVPVVPVRGLFWFPDEHTDGFVAVHNSSDQMMLVTPSFHIATENHALEAISLAPGQGYKLELRKELKKLGLHDISAGGIEFNYQGARDALKAHGVLFNDRGFSAEVDFHRYDAWTEPQEFMLRTPRFAVGSADPALGLPHGTTFEPYVVLHNFNGHPLDVSLAVNFNHGQAPQEIPLAVSLSPGETRVLSLVEQLAGQVPAGVSWGSLELCYTDRHNGVAAMLVSRSQDGEHSMRSVLNWVHGSMSEGWLWRADGEYNTLIGLLNTDTEEARAAVSLSYYVNGQGYNYELPEVTIPARTSHLVNVGDVIAAGAPDKDGDVIPASARFGGYSVRKVGRRIHKALITETLVFDRRNATFVSYYNTCCALQDPFVTPDSFSGPIGFTGQIRVRAWNNCQGTWIDITDSGTYFSSDPAVATVGGTTGNVSGVGVGSANIRTYLEYNAPTPPPENLLECPLDTNCVPPCTGTVFISDADATVTAPTFGVAYSSYIPVDHIDGPSFCSPDGIILRQLIYMGDAFRNTYRTTESIYITPDTSQSFGFYPNTGQTRNYAYPSPVNGSTLSSADEDGVRYDCYKWNDVGQASAAFSYDVSFPFVHQGQVHYSGSSANPLESQFATITWDMRTVIDTPNPQSPTAYANYNHTCYPAHQIKVNGQIIYSYTPTRHDTLYLSECLFLHIGKISGQTNPQSVPQQ